jgi:hypothetical protein
MDKPDSYPTPWVSIIVGLMILTCLQKGWWEVLVVGAVVWAGTFAYGVRDEWLKINSSTGSSPKSSSILFWRRPRPRQE